MSITDFSEKNSNNYNPKLNQTQTIILRKDDPIEKKKENKEEKDQESGPAPQVAKTEKVAVMKARASLAKLQDVSERNQSLTVAQQASNFSSPSNVNHKQEEGERLGMSFKKFLQIKKVEDATNAEFDGVISKMRRLQIGALIKTKLQKGYAQLDV